MFCKSPAKVSQNFAKLLSIVQQKNCQKFGKSSAKDPKALQKFWKISKSSAKFSKISANVAKVQKKAAQKNCKSLAKVCQKFCKSLAKVQQKFGKTLAKILQKFFKCCKISTKFLQRFCKSSKGFVALIHVFWFYIKIYSLKNFLNNIPYDYCTCAIITRSWL